MVDTTPAEVVKKPKKAGGASNMVQFDANKVPAKMGFAHLPDDIVNAYSTCLMCKHPSIVCDRSIEDVEEANRVALEGNEAKNLKIGTNIKQGSTLKKRKVALKDTSVMFSCSCLSMHCYQQPDGGTCNVCRDLGDRRPIDKEGQCMCLICECRCLASYSSTDYA